MLPHLVPAVSWERQIFGIFHQFSFQKSLFKEFIGAFVDCVIWLGDLSVFSVAKNGLF